MERELILPQREKTRPDAEAGATANPQLLARVERALVLIACFIELEDGSDYIPLYERLESELENLRRRESTKQRARQLLAAAYSLEGGSNAIFSKNLSLSSSDGPLP